MAPVETIVGTMMNGFWSCHATYLPTSSALPPPNAMTWLASGSSRTIGSRYRSPMPCWNSTCFGGFGSRSSTAAHALGVVIAM